MAMPRRRGRYGDGTLYQRGRTWWLKYRAGGRWHYESSGSADRAVAQTLLDTRRGQPYPIVMVPFISMELAEAVVIAKDFTDLLRHVGRSADAG